MLHWPRMINLIAILVVFLATNAGAQLEAWRALSEDELHSKTFGSWQGKVGELFAPCDKSGKLTIAQPYTNDYKLTKRDHAIFERGMNSVKRYANIQAALKGGYLPVNRGFVPSVGLMMAHPDLVRDGAYSLERPDIISYVKKRGAAQFRMVGLIYVAGKSRPPDMMNVDFSEKSRKEDTRNKASTETWDYEDEICVIVEPGKSVGIYNPSETPHNCKGGAKFPRMWRLYTWPLVYNPNGLFAEQNPMVDFIDRAQKFGPLCQKPR